MRDIDREDLLVGEGLGVSPFTGSKVCKEPSIRLTPAEISILRAATLLNLNSESEDHDGGSSEVWTSAVSRYGRRFVGIPRGYKASSFWGYSNVQRLLKSLAKKGLLEDLTSVLPSGRRCVSYHNVMTINREVYNTENPSSYADFYLTDPDGATTSSKAGRLYSSEDLKYQKD